MAPEPLCRLCSLTFHLFSLFSKKDVKLKNDIRKMISETIQLKLDDGVSCICFNCIVDVTHFYILKLKFMDKNNGNKENGDTNYENNRIINNNNQLLGLKVDQINPPSMNSALAIYDWLKVKKNKLIAAENNEPNSLNNKTNNIAINNDLTTCQIGTQTSSIEQISITSQTETIHSNNISEEKSVQTDTIEINSAAVQTSDSSILTSGEKFIDHNVKNFLQLEYRLDDKNNMDASKVNKHSNNNSHINELLMDWTSPSINSDDSVNNQPGKIVFKEIRKTYCKICHQKISSMDFANHRLNHLKCFSCSKVFSTTQRVKRHMNKVCKLNYRSSSSSSSIGQMLDDPENAKMPVIDLVRVDNDSNIIAKYPNLFNSYSETIC